MESTGRIIKANRDTFSRKLILTLELSEPNEQDLYELMSSSLLDVNISKHYEGRTKTANDYFHKLVRGISVKSGASFNFTKNFLMSRYGQQDFENGEVEEIKSQLEPETMLERDDIHCVPSGYEYDSDGNMWTTYRVMRGTKTYNTKEMSDLIRGTEEDAKLLGVPTKSDKEVERLLKSWKG